VKGRQQARAAALDSFQTTPQMGMAACSPSCQPSACAVAVECLRATPPGLFASWLITIRTAHAVQRGFTSGEVRLAFEVRTALVRLELLGLLYSFCR
jgi:hypothetical protein